MSAGLNTFIHKLRLIKQVILSKPAKEDNTQLFDCPVCGSSNIRMQSFPMYYFEQWQKYQTVHNPFFIETMNISAYMCTKCFAFDRERLYALYLKEYLHKKQTTPIKLLDIAPGNALSNFLKRQQDISYRSMDLEMKNVDDKLDITNMNIYDDDMYDFFICSHVLEHIPDDIKAMEELYRILKPGGRGIIMVPINLELTQTLEDPACNDAALCWKYFFQDDHVRMYAKKDFISRLSSVGFAVEQLGKNYFGEETFNKNAIYPTSVLYVVSK